MKKNDLKKACLSLSVLLGLTLANSSEVFAYNPEDIVTVGDINHSGTVDITDMTQLSLYLIGDTDFSDYEEKTADTDMNGVVDLCDLANFKRFFTKGEDKNGLIMIGKTMPLDNTLIEREPVPDEYPPAEIVPGTEVEQTVPTITEKDIDTDDKFRIEREPMPDVLPVNAENNNYDYAVLSGKTYSKRGVYIFSENQIDDKSMLAFVIEDEDTVTLSGTMAEVNILTDLSSEDVLLLKCGKTEGKYYIFVNQKITDEEAKAYLDKFGIAEYTTPDVIPDTKFEQPVSAMNP
ncbi:MAG: dockerin type I repeat-containing protein [Oscillospiraceae bacterium]